MKKLFIGLMSGTSMDAIDAVLVDLQKQPLEIMVTYSEKIPAQLRTELIALCKPGANEINRLGQLDVQVGELFAHTANSLIKKANLTAGDICAIGSHGQTVRHHPDYPSPFTLQIGDPNVIAARTSITTIADFRRRDMALGGQGAPLTPGFHNFVFRTANEERIVLNLGGIANITHLPANLQQPIIGFDTGPANTLLDMWANNHLKQPYDVDGNWSAQGQINIDLLELLLSDPYFKKNPPKSTGREYFNLAWLENHLNTFSKNIEPIDIQTTLTELTACSIAQAIQKLVTTPATILICGGGLKNIYLLQRIKWHLPHYKIHATDDFGIPAQWMEAIAFAWFAEQTLNKKPSNIPSVTGASHETILGGIYLA